MTGTYEVTFTKEGFEAERHTEVLVNGDRTTTVDGNLTVGSVATKVDVVGTPLMNQTDATTGYVVDQATIESTPLGTGSFTQLAIMSPGVHADFLEGAGTNAGLGNQAIFADGNRDTSNSFSLNGISTNNLFSGNTTSGVGENRYVLNLGERFGPGGEIQTDTSVFAAIGQALPTPPPEAIQEIAVNSAMYDATQGANSGAHISVLTKSGGNDLHGELYWKFQNSVFNAAPFFYNASPAITQKDPFLNRNQFGATLGGPIKKDKLFYFLSYQGIRIADASDALADANVPLSLTNDRSAQGIINVEQGTFGKTISASQISPQAAALLNLKLPNGQYLIPSPQITNVATVEQLGYDAIAAGPQCNLQRQSGHRQYRLRHQRQGSSDGPVLRARQSHLDAVRRSGKLAWISANAERRGPGGFAQQYRDSYALRDVGAARGLHPDEGLLIYQPGLQSERCRNQSAGLQSISAIGSVRRESYHRRSAWNSDRASVSATSACSRTSGSMEAP